MRRIHRKMTEGGRENAILPGRRAIQYFTGLHDSFYHGPICHYIDNCLGTSAGHAMAFRRM
jgi:hypothetical protein